MNRTLRLIIVGVVLVVIIVLAWFFLISPLRSDIDAVEASIETERASLSAAQAQLAQAEAIREEGEKNRGMLLELAKMVIRMTGSASRIVFSPLPQDDPVQRRPDITLAREKIGWEPRVPLEEGLEKTITYFQQVL